MLRLAVTNFFRLCRRNAAFSLLSFACLACAFASFIFIQEFGYYKYVEIVERDRETQTLFFMCSEEATAQDVYHALCGGDFPEIASVTASGEWYAGVDWGEGAEWYTPYGRFFTREEVERGAAVALLGTGYIGSLPPEQIDTIWETGIEINGRHFDAIGSHYFNLSLEGAVPAELRATEVPAPILIPLRAFWESGLAADKLRCVFAVPLTEEQIAKIDALLRTYADIHSVSLPTTGNYYAVAVYLNQVLPYTLIILLSLISTAAVLLHWLRREFVRYRIYLICGARRSQIVCLLSVAIALLVTAAYLFAGALLALVTRVAPAGALLRLPWRFHAAIYAGMLLLALLAVNCKALPLLFRGRLLEQ